MFSDFNADVRDKNGTKRQKVGTKMPMKCVLVDNEIC